MCVQRSKKEEASNFESRNLKVEKFVLINSKSSRRRCDNLSRVVMNGCFFAFGIFLSLLLCVAQHPSVSLTGKLKNFSKKSFDTTTADFDYDYASIMHYGPLFFR